jgi:hypothetical protein
VRGLGLVGAALALETVPGVSAAPVFQLGLRAANVAVLLGGTASWGQTALASGGTARASLAAGTLHACFLPPLHPRVELHLCAAAAAGALFGAASGVADATARASPYVAAGARLGVAVHVTRLLGAVLYSDVLVPLAHVDQRVAVNGTPTVVWSTPPAAVLPGMALTLDFP